MWILPALFQQFCCQQPATCGILLLKWKGFHFCFTWIFFIIFIEISRQLLLLLLRNRIEWFPLCYLLWEIWGSALFLFFFSLLLISWIVVLLWRIKRFCVSYTTPYSALVILWMARILIFFSWDYISSTVHRTIGLGQS